MEGLVVKVAETEDERRAAFDLRIQVFVNEQGVPAEEELDAADETATHAVALLNGEVVGTGRMVAVEPRSARIGRMAVRYEWRKQGIGGRILRTLEEESSRRGLKEAVLHAQTYVKSFYASHGYVEAGAAFLEVGIEHVEMRKRL